MEKTLAAIILLLTTVFTLTTVVSLMYDRPVGWDIHFHVEVARVWSRGENGMFSDVTMTINKFPYPPLFHFILVPSVLLGVEMLFLRAMQIIVYPAVMVSSTWFAWRHRGRVTGLLTLVTMMGSLAVIDGCLQLKPQALDILLLPVALDAWLHNRRWTYVAVTLYVVWSHGLVALPLFAGSYLLKLFEKRSPQWKRWLVPLVSIFLVSTPIVAVSASHMMGAAEKWSPPSDNPQERWFWSFPLFFPWYYLGAATFGFPVLLYNLRHWRTRDRWEQVVTVTCLGIALLIPWWADRFLQYIAQPFALLAANHVSKSPKRNAYLPLLLMVSLLFALMPWGWVVTDSWYVWRGDILYPTGGV